MNDKYKSRARLISEIEEMRSIIDNFQLLEIDRLKTEKRLRYLSFHDRLTGLYNRSYFNEELKRLNSNRSLPLSIIIIDVNGLKLVNDAFGHDKGDMLLKKVAKIIKRCFRKVDVLARLGGDEFGIILINTTDKEILAIIERLKDSCKENSDEIIPISFSVGFSSKQDDNKKIKDVIKEAEDNMYLNKQIEHKEVRWSMILSFKEILKDKNNKSRLLLDNVSNLVKSLGRKLIFSDEKLNELELLSVVYDIGLIAISDSILQKPGILTPEEWSKIKKHPQIGFNIAESSIVLLSLAEAILYHHEWWNGEGYPKGLKKEEIPVTARIIAIVDAYSSMINGRPYKKAMTKQEAIAELRRYAGIQFDPCLVNKFIELISPKAFNNPHIKKEVLLGNFNSSKY